MRDLYGLDWSGFSEGLAATPPGNGDALMLRWFDDEIVPLVTRAGVVRQNLDQRYWLGPGPTPRGAGIHVSPHCANQGVP